MATVIKKRVRAKEVVPPAPAIEVADSIPTAFTDLQKGDVVECVESGYFYGNKKGLIGVYGDWATEGRGDGYARVYIPARNSYTLDTLFAASYDPMSYVSTNYKYPQSSTFLNRVSGPRAAEVLRKYREWEELSGLHVKNAVSCKSGCDPEIFAIDKFGDVIPAWEFLPAKSAAVTRKCDEYGRNTAYWDGFQAEFTIAAGECMGWGMDRVRNGLGLVHNALRKHDTNAKLTLRNVVTIPPSTLSGATEEQVSLGCSPSLNAYGAAGEKVPDPRSLPWRFAGGHLHFGVGAAIKTKAVKYVKAIDAVLGVASVGMFANIDNPLRRQFYGLAGEYRLPTHGIEYRVLSNAWLCHPAVAFYCFDMARGAMGLLRTNQMSRFAIYDEERTQRVINECDVDGARELVRSNEKLYRALAWNYYGTTDGGNLALRMIYEGVENVVDVEAIEKNWMLGDEDWVSHAGSKNCTFGSLVHNHVSTKKA